MTRHKLALALVLLAMVGAFFALDLERFFTLEQVRSSQAAFAVQYAEHPARVIGVFFGIYVAVAALSIPGAAVLTLAAGAIFGLLVGTVIVSFASSLGATLAFLASRYVLGDGVRSRFGSRLAEIDRGIAREGALYLFALRLVPLLPFFAINLLMGLTAMKVRTFCWVSQLGMLAGTLVYVNAGTQLARIESLADVASPGLIGSFVLLGVFPLVSKRVVEAIGTRGVYARWRGRKPRRFDRNLVVIGAGAAGLVASAIAAAAKARVTLVEGHKMGGDCLNHGCVPSKALIRTAKLVHQMRHGAAYGIAGAQAQLSFAEVMQRVQRVVEAIEPHDSVARYRGLGVDVVLGHATIVDPWHVRIIQSDGVEVTLSTRAIVLATGAVPVVPPLPGIESVGALTSDTLWALRELPQRLVVLGGGPVGCELAQAFARLGSLVTQIERLDRLLAREDADVSAHARQVLEADGVTVLTGHRALRCERDALGARTIVVEAGGVEHRIGFDALICGVGRAARLDGYGLEALGIAAGPTVATDGRLQTIYPNIFACGDVAGPYQFTHTAAHQAWTASINALFGFIWKFRVDYSVIPRATFIDPEVARVGLNEQEAGEQGIAYEVTRYDLGDLDRAIADSAERGWIKVLTVPRRDTVLGVTIVGEHAADLLAEYVLAMKHGIGLNQILRTVHIYPTMAEANKLVAGQWKRAHLPFGALRWMQRLHDWRR
ncbi:MAG TPA: FAD-dependent oxidoreductase [Burkholderiaceae bacterium]|nr:FAD-dependent oxidoreductase [Burkholderiaceae bacterium]